MNDIQAAKERAARIEQVRYNAGRDAERLEVVALKGRVIDLTNLLLRIRSGISDVGEGMYWQNEIDRLLSENESAKPQWTCVQCKSTNLGKETKCGYCDTPRPVGSRQGE